MAAPTRPDDPPSADRRNGRSPRDRVLSRGSVRATAPLLSTPPLPLLSVAVARSRRLLCDAARRPRSDGRAIAFVANALARRRRSARSSRRQGSRPRSRSADDRVRGIALAPRQRSARSRRRHCARALNASRCDKSDRGDARYAGIGSGQRPVPWREQSWSRQRRRAPRCCSQGKGRSTETAAGRSEQQRSLSGSSWNFGGGPDGLMARGSAFGDLLTSLRSGSDAGLMHPSAALTL